MFATIRHARSFKEEIVKSAASTLTAMQQLADWTSGALRLGFPWKTDCQT
jgi:hypothetical protein